MLESKRTCIAVIVVNLFLAFFYTTGINAQYDQTYIYNNMRIDQLTGLPVAIYNVNSPQYAGTPEQIALQYLLDNTSLLGMTEDLSDLKLVEIKVSPAGHHVLFNQLYQGIPVLDLR